MELFPDRVYSKHKFTALPPYLFSRADFALIPSRDEPFGLVAVEFGRKGALSVGSRLGGLGFMPGWVSGLSYNLMFHSLINIFNSGSLSSPLQRNICCLSLERQSKKPSSPPQRSVNYSMLVQPSSVSPSSSGVSVLEISTRGVSTLAVGTRDQMPGGSWMETFCERSRALPLAGPTPYSLVVLRD